MEPSNPHALRLLNLQYGLALLIGQELRLVPMLRHFFPPALKAMRCRAAHVWLRNDETSQLELRYTYPARDAAIWHADPRFAALTESLAVIPQHPRKLTVSSTTQLLQMPLGDIGHCVLVNEGGTIDPLLSTATRPIFARLATACRASMDHERVEQLKTVAAEGEQRLRTVLETVGEVIFQADNCGTLTFLNTAWSRLSGEDIDNCLGRPLADFIHSEDEAQFLAAFRCALTDQSAVSLDARLRCANPAPRWVAIRLRYGFPGNDGASITGTMLDITEQKTAERMKHEFTSTISHELRTPLTSIKGTIDLLNAGGAGLLPDAAQKFLTIANRNCKRLHVLIDDLLDMEKLLAGKLSFNFESIELQSLLEQTLSDLQSYADNYGVRLSLTTCNDNTQVHVDPSRFQQVMNNLLSNAAKYSPQGGEVVVSTTLVDQAVRVTVRDQGPGIAAEFFPRVFEKFAQADASDTRQRGGTGLGLAITKELVEQMQGRIGFESPPGEGATFWFELPTQIPTQIPTRL